MKRITSNDLPSKQSQKRIRLSDTTAWNGGGSSSYRAGGAEAAPRRQHTAFVDLVSDDDDYTTTKSRRMVDIGQPKLDMQTDRKGIGFFTGFKNVASSHWHRETIANTMPQHTEPLVRPKVKGRFDTLRPMASPSRHESRGASLASKDTKHRRTTTGATAVLQSDSASDCIATPKQIELGQVSSTARPRSPLMSTPQEKLSIRTSGGSLNLGNSVLPGTSQHHVRRDLSEGRTDSQHGVKSQTIGRGKEDPQAGRQSATAVSEESIKKDRSSLAHARRLAKENGPTDSSASASVFCDDRQPHHLLQQRLSTPYRNPFAEDPDDHDQLFIRSSSDAALCRQHDRERRIVQMRQRNERNRQADLLECDDDAEGAEHSSDPRPDVVADAVLSPPNSVSAIIPTPPPPPPLAKASGVANARPARGRLSGRKLLPISFADVLGLSMRDVKKREWAHVTLVYCTHTGEQRSITTVQKRMAKVRKAFHIADVPSLLIEEVLRELPGALQKINDLIVHKVGGSLDRAAVRDSGEENDTASIPPLTLSVSSSDVITLFEDRVRSSTEHARGSSVIPSALGIKQAQAAPGTEAGQAVGGKQPSWELLQTYWRAQPDEDSDVTSECTEDNDHSNVDDTEDFVHYSYQPQRREWRNPGLEDDDCSIDDMEWHDVGEAYTSLTHANAAACGKILLLKVGASPIVDGSQRYSIIKDSNDTGCTTCQYDADAGIVQTRVVRRLRSYQNQVVVHDKTSWHSRTVYYIKQRTTSTVSQPELSDRAGRVEVVECLIDGELCADLAWSNARAVEHFVDKTYENRSANLNIRSLEIAGLRKSLMEEVEARGDDVLFKAEKAASKGKVEVWVEQGKLVGPRNI